MGPEVKDKTIAGERSRGAVRDGRVRRRLLGAQRAALREDDETACWSVEVRDGAVQVKSTDVRSGTAEVGELLDRSRRLFSDHALRRRMWEAGGGQLSTPEGARLSGPGSHVGTRYSQQSRPPSSPGQRVFQVCWWPPRGHAGAFTCVCVRLGAHHKPRAGPV